MAISKANSLPDKWVPNDKSFRKRILIPGSGSVTPNDGAFCTIYLTILDTSLDDMQLGEYMTDVQTDITIGEGDTTLSQLFDVVLMSMREEEQCLVETKTDEANFKLKFKLHLVSFSRAADISELLVDEKLEKAEHHKNKGTLIYNNNFNFSLERFRKSLIFLDAISLKQANSCQQKKIHTLKLQCHLNLAAGMLLKENFEEALKHCNAALEIEPNNVKGLYRRSQALHSFHKYKESADDLKEALIIEPGNKAVLTFLKKVEAASLKEKLFYKKMFT